MKAKKIVANTHEEWLAMRKDGIGASEVGTIMGVNEYDTLYQLWDRKKNNAANVENEAMLWGHLLEDAVSQRYAIATEAHIIKTSAKEFMYVMPDHEYLRVSPDRLYYPKGVKHSLKNLALLECKTSLMGIDKDRLPMSYVCQVQYQMYVSGIHNATLAWFNLRDRSFDYVDIEYDEQFCEKMVGYIQEFWVNYILGNKIPSAETVVDLKLKYPRSIEGKVKQADAQEVASAYALAEVKQKLKAIEESEEYKTLKTKEEELQLEVKKFMEDNEILIDAAGKILLTYKSAKEKEVFNSKKALAENPELSKYVERTAGTRSLLNKIKA